MHTGVQRNGFEMKLSKTRVKKQGDKNVNCFKPTPFSSERIVLNLLEKRLNFSYNRTNKGKGKTSIVCNIF